ncbi:uncharacterized protein LOC126603446 [Malus sylvestris]|uniref:uncharacterized protein LOC126603446 n=1 Tax=Malus sylvestris TaxID=3752 RepID=UPI0021ABC056|nr:uncharacterized protein LOC126603446 [Malus sylvestris]
MSKKSINGQSNGATKRNQNITNSEYNTLFELDQRPKKVCRINHMHNSEDVYSRTNTFVLQNSSVEYQCSTSRSSADHCDIASVNESEMLDVTPLKKKLCRDDQKGKNVVSFSNNDQNTVEKTSDADNCTPMNKGQAFFQKNRNGVTKDYADLGDKSYKCVFCGAYFWLKESLKQSRKKNQPIFTVCCQQGKIIFPAPKPTPTFLNCLLDPNGGQKSLSFRENIRAYNSMFSFTSTGAKIDHSINDGSSPYIFKISGQVCQLMGSLLPTDNEPPKFAQLYVYDTYNEVQNRLRAFNSQGNNRNLDSSIVQELIKMFDECNQLVKFFRTARDKFEIDGLINLTMTLLGRQPRDSKQYDQPASDEIGGLIVGDIGLSDSNRDIIIDCKNEGLKRVTKLNPKFMALQYPILFPYGEDGYRPDLKWNENYKGPKTKSQRVPMRAYIAYQIQEREMCLTTLLKGGRLFQQYLVDSYATLEEDRLYYIKQNQKNLRSEIYKGIYDAMSRGDNDANNLGQKIVLPASYTGSPRYMINNYQDAMAICREYGHPDLFITFTCNVKWPEIIREFEKKPGFKPEDRPDIISRIFKMKLNDMLDFIKSGRPFGQVEANVCTIEFQKRE